MPHYFVFRFDVKTQILIWLCFLFCFWSHLRGSSNETRVLRKTIPLIAKLFLLFDFQARPASTTWQWAHCLPVCRCCFCLLLCLFVCLVDVFVFKLLNRFVIRIRSIYQQLRWRTHQSIGQTMRYQDPQSMYANPRVISFVCLLVLRSIVLHFFTLFCCYFTSLTIDFCFVLVRYFTDLVRANLEDDRKASEKGVSEFDGNFGNSFEQLSALWLWRNGGLIFVPFASVVSYSEFGCTLVLVCLFCSVLFVRSFVRSFVSFFVSVDSCTIIYLMFLKSCSIWNTELRKHQVTTKPLSTNSENLSSIRKGASMKTESLS